MKTILAATDFSDSAQNAVEYAASLAELTDAQLILFHAYHVPIVASEVPTMMFTLNEMETSGLENLQEIAAQLKQSHPLLTEIECICRHGFVVEEIEGLMERQKANLVVMGLQGTNFLGEKLIGSNSSALVKQALFPVVVVHHELKFKEIKRILLATDDKKIKDPAMFDPLKKIAARFGSHIYVVKVMVDKNQISEIEEASEKLLLGEFLEETDHSFYKVKASDVVKGVNAFADRKKIDLTVVIARNHTFFESFFHSDHVRNMIFHAHTPLLTIHE